MTSNAYILTLQLIEMMSANWCDSCGDFLWSSVANNNNQPSGTLTTNDYAKYLRCSKCKYICHYKCRSLVRIDCQGVDDTLYLFQPLSRPPTPLFNETLKMKISKYNE